MSVRVRYAPSPTGDPHLGNIRTALFDWLLARHAGGRFILRIEDTDRTRYVEAGVQAQMEALRWLGLDWDEGPEVGGPHAPYVQSQRLKLYQRYAEQLLQDGHAYRCYCSPERLEEVRQRQQRAKAPPKYDRRCRDLPEDERQRQEAQGVTPVVRFRTPLTGETIFHDIVRGAVTFQNDTLDDFVLLKSDGYPTYHLASIVDDHLMEISHVLRGEEWLSSAPRHDLVYRALDWEPPAFAHLPSILGPDRARLAKRHGAKSVLEYRDEGYLPEAVFNYLGLLGWSLDDRTEIISREEFVRHFTLDRVLPHPAVFNPDKLEWMNGIYIRQLPPDELAQRVKPFLERALGSAIDEHLLRRAVPLIQERIKVLADAVAMADFFFVGGELDYTAETLLGKKLAGSPAQGAACLKAVLARVEGIVPWEHEALEGAIRPLAEELGLKAGDLFGLVRVAVTGKTATPPLFETMEVLGREKTLERLRSAQRRLGAPAARE
ncbi:MAG TPA: glutamate--tRNA ligase [Dehalococcoidia bacterium]|nr:glutamate--tRNA ligase [Dehalococcoidia bacterium]